MNPLISLRDRLVRLGGLQDCEQKCRGCRKTIGDGLLLEKVDTQSLLLNGFVNKFFYILYKYIKFKGDIE
jgi:hypothetical protein